MIDRGTKVLIIIAFILALTIGLLYAFCKINTAQTLEISALTTLVILTAWYAKQTTTIAKETKKQRFSESLPLLVPDIIKEISEGIEHNEIAYESLQTGIGLKVYWHNLGKGVAINSRFSFWGAPLSSGKAIFFPPRESQTLEVGGMKEVDYGKILNDSRDEDISKSYKSSLIAEYKDIYERDITTVQEFRIDK